MSGKSGRTIFIHIGTEKTGTTSIQSFLTKNALRLSVSGLWYPTEHSAPYCESNAHFPIVASLLGYDADFVSPAKSLLRGECIGRFLDDCHVRPEKNVVISAEHFSSRLHDADRLAGFRHQLLGVFDRAVIIVYVRSQVSLAPSSYSTGVKCGRASRLDPDEITPANPYFNALTILDLWAGVFGKENIIARELETRSLKNGDICQDFLGVLGLSGELMESCPRENPSLSLAKLEALRRINACLPSFEKDAEAWRGAQQLRGIYIAPHLQSEEPDHPFKLNDAEALQILDRFRQANEALNERYFSGRLSMSWFFLQQEESHPSPRREDESRYTDIDGQCLSSVFPRTVIAMATRLRSAVVENRRLADNLLLKRQELEHLTSKLHHLECQLQKMRSTKTWKLRQKFISAKKRVKAKAATN